MPYYRKSYTLTLCRLWAKTMFLIFFFLFFGCLPKCIHSLRVGLKNKDSFFFLSYVTVGGVNVFQNEEMNPAQILYELQQ